MNTTPSNRNLDVDEELAVLEKRKSKLERLIKLRSEVDKLETTTKTGSRDAVAMLKIICEEVCRHYNISMELLGRQSREEFIVMPRQIAFYLIRELSDMPLNGIGNAFRKDHGTVIHGCKKVRERKETDRRFAATLERLKSTVEARLKAAEHEQRTATN